MSRTSDIQEALLPGEGTLELESLESYDSLVDEQNQQHMDKTATHELSEAINTLLFAHSFPVVEGVYIRNYDLTEETYEGSLFQLNEIDYDLAKFVNMMASNLLISLKKDPTYINVTFGLLTDNTNITEATDENKNHAIQIEYEIRRGALGIPSGAFAPASISSYKEERRSKICAIQ